MYVKFLQKRLLAKHPVGMPFLLGLGACATKFLDKALFYRDEKQVAQFQTESGPKGCSDQGDQAGCDQSQCAQNNTGNRQLFSLLGTIAVFDHEQPDEAGDQRTQAEESADDSADNWQARHDG